MFQYLPRILPYLRPYRRLAAVLVALIVLSGAAELLAPWPLKILVDNALGDHPLPEWLQAVVGPGPFHCVELVHDLPAMP